MLKELYKIIGETPIDKTALTNLIPILKELDELDFCHPAHCYGVLDHSAKAAETLEDVFLRLVMIFHDVGKLTTATKVANRKDASRDVTKFPGHQQESVRIAKSLLGDELGTADLAIFLKLIEYHDTSLVVGNNREVMQQLMQDYGVDFVGNLLKVQRADMSTHDKKYYEVLIKSALDRTCDIYEEEKAKTDRK